MPLNIEYRGRKSSPHLKPNLIAARMEKMLELLGVGDKNVTIVFMGDAEIAAFNLQYRKKKGPTNVLSFPVDADFQFMPPHLIEPELGDILVSLDTAVREAETGNKTVNDRLTELVIHGLLHLLGFDHERSDKDAWDMWDREQKLMHDLKHFRRNTMVKLAVNVDHVATVRQARGTVEPDPITAAAICELAGAAGIVVHLREDRRHIQDRDVRLLRQTVKTRLNLEMAASKEMIDIALDLKPDMVTLVPEKRQELTTEGGLNVRGQKKKITKAVEQLNEGGIPVSLFTDPDPKQIKASRDAGATFVELHTGRYCDAGTADEVNREFELIEESAALARAEGLRVNAGHGLDYRNTSRIAALDSIEELSIGHAIVSRAVFVGLDQAVREMLALIRPPFPGH